MEITFLGHSSFRIKGSKLVVVTDPFDPLKVGLKYPKVTADIVTVSHDHQDHNQVQLVSEVKKVIDGPGEYELAGVSVIGISSFHDDKKGELRGKNTIFVIEMDGLRLVHLGDLGHPLKNRRREEIGEVDILMIPVGGEYTLGPKEAASVVHTLEPKIILPMHFQMAGLNAETFAKLAKVDEFTTELELRVERADKLKVNEGSLPQEEQVVCLLEKK